ncbi:ABC-2 transporter permease [Pseudogracilibacillus sp. SO30301A]|uniref:ABC-2 transporter permease n=1 Tax=Pseudogracilibacillus sp. SO30301A TaxID=3098291 RepID=UPI00300E6448
MLTLIKKDFLTNSWFAYVGIVLFIGLTYVVTLPPTFMFIITFFGFFGSIFLYDDKNNVNLFLKSLPVKMKSIVLARYLYSVLLIILILLMQTGVMALFSSLYSKTHYMYSFRDIIVLFCIGCIIIALCIPVFFKFQSAQTAMGIMLTLFGIGSFFTVDALVKVLGMTESFYFNDLDPGFVMLAEKYLPFFPYVTLLIGTAILLTFSIHISTAFFKEK